MGLVPKKAPVAEAGNGTTKPEPIAGERLMGLHWHGTGEWRAGTFTGWVHHGNGCTYAQLCNEDGLFLVIKESLRLAPAPDCPSCSGAHVDPVETHHQAMQRIFTDGFAAIAAAIRGEHRE